jgi:hypothetical protein
VNEEDQAREALAVVLRSARPDRFKALTVACPNDHVLARIYRTAVGLQAVGLVGGEKGDREHNMPDGSVVTLPVRGPRVNTTSSWLHDGHYTCRCGRYFVDADEVEAAIAQGRRRLRVAAPRWRVSR